MTEKNTITTDEVKELLRQGRNIDNRIKMLEETQEKAYARVTSATQKLSETGVHGGPQADAMAEYVALSEEIVDEISNLQRMQKAILLIILRVRKHKLQSVLQLYYIDGLKWQEVAARLHYDCRYVLKLHGTALLEVKRILERNPYMLKACGR